MTTELEKLHKELTSLKKDVDYIKNLLREDYELGDHAKKALKEARETPSSEYIDL